jgi:hypothetical protein
MSRIQRSESLALARRCFTLIGESFLQRTTLGSLRQPLDKLSFDWLSITDSPLLFPQDQKASGGLMAAVVRWL